VSSARAIVGLVIWICVCFGAGAIGSVFTARSVGDWYSQLSKPFWTPPSAVFGPVWSLLYLLMGIAAWDVWRRTGVEFASAPILLFCLQLLSNTAWSALFFGLRAPGAAFMEIIFLWSLILATLVAFLRHSTLAGVLMIPYLAWVTFAAALNFAVWRMNAS
jgi:tryptophan-rich sensory protein